MERMYLVITDDDIPLSEKDKDNIKVLCYLLYDSITNYEDYNHLKILNEDILYNVLIESKTPNGYIHRLTHNYDEALQYEPFMPSDRIFGFTVHDGSIDEHKIFEMLEENAIDVSIPYHYNFKIISKTYEPDKKNRNRQHTINKFNEELTNQQEEEMIKKKLLKIYKDD